jgi:hypothetical protein
MFSCLYDLYPKITVLHIDIHDTCVFMLCKVRTKLVGIAVPCATPKVSYMIIIR